jgi:hypothetical protein
MSYARRLQREMVEWVMRNHLPRGAHLAVFGNVGLIRANCPECRRMAIQLDGEMQCCGYELGSKPDRWKRVVEPEFNRRLPSANERAAALWRQEGRCIYCTMRFGSYAWRSSKQVKLLVRWDHFVPYSYSANNADANFVAACQICNGIKSDKMFDTLDEAQVYIAARRQTE